MFKLKVYIFSILVGFMLVSCSGGGDSTSTNTNATNTTGGGQVSLTGVVVTPNLGPVSGSVTVEAVDLTTNKLLGSTTTQNPDGTFTVPNAASPNPVIIKVTGGQYLDEATGTNQPLPASGISACLPNASQVTNVAVTPITEIATQAALKTGTVTAAVIDAANKNVGSALLNGADPTTTIPVDISKATPATATAAQKNYTRVLAGLAVVAKNSGQDLYTAAQTITSALFDAYGQPALSTGGTLPAEIVSLQTEVQNYVAVGSIPASNVPPADAYATIGLVNPGLTSNTPVTYNYMEVFMDPYVAGQGQSVSSTVELGVDTPNIQTGVSSWKAFAVFSNGSAIPVASGSHDVNINPYGQMLWTPTGNPNNISPLTIDFSKDGEFAVGQQIADNAPQRVRITMLVKKPLIAPTKASVAGVYHLFLMAHDSSMAPTAMPGYTEHHLLTLDGQGGSTLVGVNNDQSTGSIITTSINSTSTYTVDAYGAVLGTGGNGHLIFSANGQYALYELHAAGTQEWGVAIKDHANNIPFSAMTSAIVFDVHSQGLPMGVDWHKGINYARITPPTVAGSSANMGPVKAFIPAQVAPNLYCGTTTTPTCGMPWPALYQPLTGTGNSAIKGEFKFNDVSNGIANPFYIGDGYISANGDVSLVEDRGWALVIGLGR